MSIDDLTRLAQPPKCPLAFGNPLLWDSVERHLGTPLPADYKQLINLYGAGSFYDFLSFISPFNRDGTLSENGLFQWADNGREQYIGMKESFGVSVPEKFPFPAFPEHGGLLAVGGYEYGGTIYWLTIGDPDEWTIVVYSEDFFEFRKYDMSLSGFLTQWLSGILNPPMFDDDLCDRSKPIFR